MAAPQFGEPESGRSHADRPGAFGIVVREGRIALVQVEKPGHAPWVDLPGGGIDPGEDERQALVREFGEETGLFIEPGELFATAAQYYVHTDGGAFNSRASFWTAEAVREAPELKIEEEHTLVWFAPHEALARLRHDAHAWAVAAWLRRKA